MRSFPIFCVVALAAIIVGADVLKEKDAEVIQDENLFQEVYACIMDQAPCPDKLKKLKEDLPKALQQACAKCTPAQKHDVKIFLDALKEKQPAKYDDLKKKYDADNKYFPNLEAAIAAF